MINVGGITPNKGVSVDLTNLVNNLNNEVENPETVPTDDGGVDTVEISGSGTEGDVLVSGDITTSSKQSQNNGKSAREKVGSFFSNLWSNFKRIAKDGLDWLGGFFGFGGDNNNSGTWV